MNLALNYSLSAGVPVGTPKLREEYFPLVVDNYITIQPFSKPSKSYDFWEEVIILIKPYLDNLGITIVQLGGDKEKNLSHCLHLQGKTSINNTNYILKKSKLHIGADSYLGHVAGIYDIKRVILYSNNSVENVGPFFGNPDNQVSFEAPGTKKPIYALDEGPIKRINNIKPEEIARAVLKFLNIEYKPEFKTIEFGPMYNTKIIEMTPTQVVNPAQFGADKMIVRMDFFFNESFLVEQLKMSPCVIFTKKEINPDILKTFRNQRIVQLIYILDEKNSNPKFIEFCQSLGIVTNVLSYLPEDKINTFKLDYSDLGIIHSKSIMPTFKKESLDIINNNSNLHKLYFKSAKTIIHDSKFYPSYFHLLQNKDVKDFNQVNSLFPIGDAGPTFWRDWEHCYFLIKND